MNLQKSKFHTEPQSHGEKQSLCLRTSVWNKTFYDFINFNFNSGPKLAGAKPEQRRSDYG